jgi:hypothetical protein
VVAGWPALRECLGVSSETETRCQARKQARSLAMAVRLLPSFSVLDDKEWWSDRVLD